jgi:hypothetical protein
VNVTKKGYNVTQISQARRDRWFERRGGAGGGGSAGAGGGGAVLSSDFCWCIAGVDCVSIPPRIRICDFRRDLRRQQARRPASETAGTAVLLFTNLDARKHIRIFRSARDFVGADYRENGVRENGVRVQILTKCLSNLRFPSITVFGVRESAGINRLGNENERVVQRTTSH